MFGHDRAGIDGKDTQNPRAELGNGTDAIVVVIRSLSDTVGGIQGIGFHGRC